MAEHTELFFYYALIPESPVQDEITAMKQEAARQFDSVRALRSPAHITLIPPVKQDRELMQAMDQVVAAVALVQRSFQIHCRDFGAFPPRVIYVDVADGLPLQTLVSTLRHELSRTNLPASAVSLPFSPHITIAFRDLAKEQFEPAWDWFRHQSYRASWEPGGIWRLIHHGTHWEPERFFPFSQADT